MKMVFMGTPEFAVPSLRSMGDHTILGVFCQPDRPKGRSRKPLPCPVKQVAGEMGLTVFQPKRIRMRKWVTLLREMAPDVIVVAAFGQILPQSILDIPTIDCVNVHASLLPRWRGASPIHYALLSGDLETGVAIMKMVRELDAGPVYALEKAPIPPGMSRTRLERELAQRGGDLLARTLPKLSELRPVPQDPDQVTYAPIIQKHFGYVNFLEQNAFEIERMVRAFEDWPGVFCRFRENPIKLLKVTAVSSQQDGVPGAVIEVTRKRLVIACAEHSALEIVSVQPAGKKAQTAGAFINGYRPVPGETFQSGFAG